MGRSRAIRAALPAVFLAGVLLFGPATGPASALALATPTALPGSTATPFATSAATSTPTASPTRMAPALSATPTAAATAVPPSATTTATAIVPTASATPGPRATGTAAVLLATSTPSPSSAIPTVAAPSPLPTPAASPAPAPGTPTATPTAGALVSPTGSPTFTATVSLTASATSSPTVTATVSPTPAPVRITGITPASVTNTAPVSITVLGSGFAPGQLVTIGDRPLTELRVLSASQVVGTLAPGLCPGDFTAGITPPGGAPVVGGQIAVQGIHAASFLGAMPSWSITLDGTDQRRQLPLPAIQVVDTTCGTGDWRIHVAVAASTERGKGHPTFLPQALAVTLAGADRPEASLDLRHAAAGVVTIPRPPGATTAVVTATLTVLVPASSYAGQQSVPVSVTLLDAG
jgi:hypothetical protein